MDDPTSRQQIDELADLYLTGVIDESDSPAAPDDAPPDHPLEGPEPIRLSPKAAEHGAPDANNGPANDYQDPDDRHPVLRLTETDEEDTSSATATQDASTQAGETEHQAPAADTDEPAPQAMLEAVLLGNLPGMSGPWLTQYAQLIAQSEGPVALLHVGDEAIDLELIEPRAEAEPAPAAPTAAVRIPPMRGNKTGLVGLIDALTRSETAPTRTILVRLDADDDAQARSRFAAIHNWTLLCGADDASVAAAGRELRTLVRADPRLADRSVGVMVMGSDEPSARAAARRVANEADGDLASPVQFIGHLKRMQPVQVRELGSFPDPVAVWPQLVAWFDTLEVPEYEPEPEPVLETVVPEPTPEPAPQRSQQPPVPAPTIPRQAPKAPRLSDAAAKIAAPQPPASRPKPRPVFTATPPKPQPEQKAPHRPTPQPQTEPQPQPEPEPPAARRPEPAPQPARPAEPRRPEPQPTREAPRPTPTPTATATTERPPASTPTRPAPRPRVLARHAELDLIALVAQGPAALQDPAALDARIPDQPDTQLAVDAQGVVHILARHDTDAASTDARQAVMQLIEAGRWVREHLELLALTQRDRDFTDADPVLHLLTDRADLTTQLVGKLAGQVKLHLLQQVKLGRESGWFCTPLG